MIRKVWSQKPQLMLAGLGSIVMVAAPLGLLSTRLGLLFLVLIFLVLFFMLGGLLPPGFFLLEKLVLLGIFEGTDAISRAWQPANAVADLTAANKGYDNAATDDEGQHEAVDRVPGWCPAALGGARVGVVLEVEGQELRDQSGLCGQHDGRPRHSWRKHTNGVAAVALVATEACPFEAPVDGAKEGDDLVLPVRPTGSTRRL